VSDAIQIILEAIAWLSFAAVFGGLLVYAMIRFFGGDEA
jgi:hypothetical protein